MDSTTYQLGPSVAAYQGRLSRMILGVLFGGLFILLGGALLATTISIAVETGTPDVTGIVIPLILMALGGFIVWRSILHRQHHVQVFEQGLVDQKGKKSKVVCWDDVVRIRFNNPSASNRTAAYLLFGSIGWMLAGGSKEVRIEMTDGTKLKYGEGLTDLEGLGRTVQSRVAEALKPRYMERIDIGETIEFGGLKFSSSNIMRGNKALPWHQVERVQINEGKNELQVVEKGKRRNWATLNINRTFNGYLAYVLASENLAKHREV